MLVVVNFTPKTWEDFRLAVPFPGSYRLLLSSDERRFGGGGTLSEGRWEAEDIPLHGRDHSLTLTLPPLAVLFLRGD